METSILDLPEDVIGVILLKCSAKSIVGLKCVCKQWQSMISDPRFCRAHLKRRSKNDRRLMEFRAGDARIDIDLMSFKDGEIVRESWFQYEIPRKFSTYPICNCDGILMFRAEDDDEYLLLNPSIHKHIVIPAPPMDGDGEDSRLLLSLTYDARDGGNYEVMCVSKRRYAVYSCRNMRWGEMKDLPCRRPSHAWDGAFFNLHGDDEVQYFPFLENLYLP